MSSLGITLAGLGMLAAASALDKRRARTLDAIIDSILLQARRLDEFSNSRHTTPQHANDLEQARNRLENVADGLSGLRAEIASYEDLPQ